MFYGVASNTLSGSTFGVSNGMANPALSFATVTDIRDTNIRVQPQVLLNNMNGWGLVDKQKALYPFVSDGYIESRATQHKYNLINPADTNAAFRLTFSGGWTHSATGAKPNGTTGYAETYFNPVTNLADYTTSGHFSTYLRTNAGAVDAPMGFYQTTAQATYVGYKSGGLFYSGWGVAAGAMNYAAASNTGLFVVSRTGLNVTKNYQSGVDKVTNVLAAAPISNNITIGGVWTYASSGSGGGSMGAWSSRESAFASIGNGLDATENTNLYNLIQAFNTSLSRQI